MKIYKKNFQYLYNFFDPNYGFEISANSQQCENARFSKANIKYKQSVITAINLAEQNTYIQQCSRFFSIFLEFLKNLKKIVNIVLYIYIAV